MSAEESTLCDAQPDVSEEEFDNMNPEKHRKITETMKSDPAMKIVLENLERTKSKFLQQTRDPFSSYRGEENKFYTPDMFQPYTKTSPTAQKHMYALENYMFGFLKLIEFKKQSIETDADCEFLKDAFQSYAWAHMANTLMFAQFCPAQNTFTLLEEYIQRRPHDVLAQYFKLAMIFHKPSPGQTKYEGFKEKIIAGELLAEKTRHLSGVAEERIVLISTYYLLGSMYRVTDQTDRALDAFQKCLELDPTNIDAIYGVACHKKYSDADEAVKLLHRYLDMAPKCDKKYPNALYQLGSCYLSYYNNQKEALKYYKAGLKAEEERLPFVLKSHSDIPEKRLLETISKLCDMKGQRN